MKIAVIGGGNVGGTLAARFAETGHEVWIAARDPSSNKYDALKSKGVGVLASADALARAEVILVATPAEAAADAARMIGKTDRIIIDATNSVRSRPEPYANGFEAIKDITGSPNVVKCFNSCGVEVMANPVFGSDRADMFAAGSSAAAKRAASELALGLGFGDCHDFGGDDRAALLEQLALSWINMAIFQKHGRGMAFRILRR